MSAYTPGNDRSKKASAADGLNEVDVQTREHVLRTGSADAQVSGLDAVSPPTSRASQFLPQHNLANAPASAMAEDADAFQLATVDKVTAAPLSPDELRGREKDLLAAQEAARSMC